MVHLARPSGAALHATAMSLLRRDRQLSRDRRHRTLFSLQGSVQPLLTKRCRALATVLRWHRSVLASSSSFKFGHVHQAASKIWACLIRCAALCLWRPFSNCLRSVRLAHNISFFFRHDELPCSKNSSPKQEPESVTVLGADLWKRLFLSCAKSGSMAAMLANPMG